MRIQRDKEKVRKCRALYQFHPNIVDFKMLSGHLQALQHQLRSQCQIDGASAEVGDCGSVFSPLKYCRVPCITKRDQLQ